MPTRATRATTTSRASRHDTALPQSFTPQLATLVAAAPTGDDWLHEIKIDGYRIGCRIDHGEVTLASRNNKDWTAQFPSIVEAARELPLRAGWLDGEIAVVLPDGRTSFQALQNRPADSSTLAYFVFDCLHRDGEDLTSSSLIERKRQLTQILAKIDSKRGPIRYLDHVVGHGDAFLTSACRHGLEGIVSKRSDAPYVPGRGTMWVKTKCTLRQEFVIGGFTEPEGSRVGLGALLLGVHDISRVLVFAGKVGTGFTHKSAMELRARLDQIQQTDCPFRPRPPTRIANRAHWVAPRLVAEVAFTEWTDDGRIRHPSFQGLRTDKSPATIVREHAQVVATTRKDR